MTTPNAMNTPDEKEELSTPEANTGQEKSEDPVTKKSKDRAFRDKVIDKEEVRWNTAEKQNARIEEEKAEIKKGLKEYASKIEDGIKNRKDKLVRVEDLPGFLRECGVKDETVRALEKAFPSKAEGVEPRFKHLVTALYDTVNSMIGMSSFPEGSFSSRVLRKFEEKRRATFVKDDTKHAKYLDRLGEGFYSSEEGQALIREKAAEEVQPTSMEEAA